MTMDWERVLRGEGRRGWGSWGVAVRGPRDLAPLRRAASICLMVLMAGLIMRGRVVGDWVVDLWMFLEFVCFQVVVGGVFIYLICD